MSVEPQDYPESYFLSDYELYDLPEENKFGVGNALTDACAKNDLDTVKSLIADGSALLNSMTNAKRTPLMIAVLQGNTDMARVLLEAGADPAYERANCGHILNLACNVNAGDMVKLLLENKRTKIDGVDGNGRTAIGTGVFIGAEDIVNQLIAAGAPVNAPKSTPDKRVAYLASLNHRKELFERFLEHTDLKSELREIVLALCVDLRHDDDSIMVLLMHFIEKQHPELIQELLSLLTFSFARAAGKDKQWLLRVIAFAKKHNVKFGDVPVEAEFALPMARVRSNKLKQIVEIAGPTIPFYIFAHVLQWKVGTTTLEENDVVTGNYDQLIEKLNKIE